MPLIGHACGHNLIAAAAAGAGVAAKPAVDQCDGRVLVIGTPGDELSGTKAIMANKGIFESMDIAILAHPGTHDSAATQTLASQYLNVEFFGQAAHTIAQPERGNSALEAMILAFNNVNLFAKGLDNHNHVHGIITDGGNMASLIPAYTAATFLVRAKDKAALGELKPALLDCFTQAAKDTNTQLEYTWGDLTCAPMRNNPALARLFADNMCSLGRNIPLTTPDKIFGSTDMGNISQIIPSIHPIVAIAPEETLIQQPPFAVAAASAAGIHGLADSAKAQAMTIIDLLNEPENLNRVRADFQQGKWLQ